MSEKAHWIEAFGADFTILAHDHQLPPERANSGENWTTWLILGGRGAGKTRAGAQWVRDVAAADCKARIALVGETEQEVRAVMVEGVSGLLAVHRDDERPQWLPTLRRVQWKNGAVAQLFSAENFEALRGPQFSAAWCNELAKWRQVLGLGTTDGLTGDVAQWAALLADRTLTLRNLPAEAGDRQWLAAAFSRAGGRLTIVNAAVAGKGGP